MTNRQNVSIEQIDRLRAGLLDHSPNTKKRVESALREDQSLTAEYSRWEKIRQQLETAEDGDIRLKNQLRLRRRSVLSGHAVKKPRRFTLPQMALATAASVALTLSVVLWFTDNSQTAVVMQPGDDTTTGFAYKSTAKTNVDFDLTNNVDFYVWMERQNELFTEAPRNGT